MPVAGSEERQLTGTAVGAKHGTPARVGWRQTLKTPRSNGM